MAAIGSIRKHGVLLIIIVGVALLAFLLGDFDKFTYIFSNKNVMVKVDGKQLNEKYDQEFNQNLLLLKVFNNKQTLSETETYQMHEFTWEQILEEEVLNDQLKGLGIVFSDEVIVEITEEMVASLTTQNPNQYLAKLVEYLAPNGDYQQAISLISNIEDYKNDERAREIYSIYKGIQRITINEEKKKIFYSLTQNGVQFSDQLAKQLGENNKTATAQFIALNPNTPVFNDVKPSVSEKEMKEYYSKNKSRYKRTNDTRDIDLAVFQVAPSAEDLKAIEDSVRAKYHRFIEAPSIVQFNIDEMEGTMDSTYYKRSDINIDTLAALIFDRPVGTPIEPYNYEEMIWYFGKPYGVAKRSDSVQVAFLVIDYQTDSNPTSTRTKESATALKDSLENVLKSKQATIFELTPSYLGGRAATDTTMWVPERGTIPDLYNHLLETPIGDFYTQENPNAFVIFGLVAKTEPIEKRQFVLYHEEIKPSDATISSIRKSATDLRHAATNADQFVEEANKRGIQLVQGVDVPSMGSQILQIQNVREAIGWAFAPETKVDEISEIFNYENQMFYVAALRSIQEKGVPKFKEVKEEIEKELLAEKKLEMIQTQVREELSKGTSMAQIAEKYKTPLVDSAALTFAGESYQNRQIENSAIGKIFNLSPNTPSVVDGTNFLYAISVHSFGDAPQLSENYQIEKMALRNILFGRMRTEEVKMKYFKDQLDVVDQRHLFYSR
ncbi:MAG TPA: SurA N-terminal domain-containing protein [Bacteroidales bacterium]|nr:SurA N-terminal domain-containing protein [Bacteroidales bacterium]